MFRTPLTPLCTRARVAAFAAAGAVSFAIAGALAAAFSPPATAQPKAAAMAAPAMPTGDPARGKAIYQGCEGCHAIDENDVGPKHRGVVGRRAGVVPGYTYSAALKGSGLTWDEQTLDRWLVNPSALVPGTKMFFKLDDAQSRADVIAYLKQQK